VAQVYSFTDENGVTRLFAEIHPEPAFNGGTITEALTVDPPTDTTALTLNAAADNTTDLLLIHADSTDLVNTEFLVDRHGNLRIASGGSFQEASITLVDNTSGNPGQIALDTFTGVLVGPEGSSNNLLTLAPAATHSGRQLSARGPGSLTETLAVSVGGYLLVKTHAAPADAALAAGECAVWFDQTNGAAAFNIKAKQADGTVKTATIPVIT
jgi:hypothetical protein